MRRSRPHRILWSISGPVIMMATPRPPNCQLSTAQRGFKPESPRLGPPEASFGSIMNGFKIPMKNPSLYLSSFKTNVLISLSHWNQAVFPCTKILVFRCPWKAIIYLSFTNKKSTFDFTSFNTLRFGKFFNNFSNTKLVKQQLNKRVVSGQQQRCISRSKK